MQTCIHKQKKQNEKLYLHQVLITLNWYLFYVFITVFKLGLVLFLKHFSVYSTVLYQASEGLHSLPYFPHTWAYGNLHLASVSECLLMCRHAEVP